jgi:hypothetical protein
MPTPMTSGLPLRARTILSGSSLLMTARPYAPVSREMTFLTAVMKSLFF